MTPVPDLDSLDLRLERELDGQGVPRTLPIHEWMETLLAIKQMGPLAERPESQRARLVGFLLALLRRTRPDGGAFFLHPGDRKSALARLAVLMRWAKDPSIATVLRRWNPKSEEFDGDASPPLPTDQRLEFACSVLRPSWSRQGDWLAIDHRDKSPSSLVELGVGGRAVLGPCWKSDGNAPLSKPPTVTFAKSSALADAVEWTFRSDRSRLTRSAVLLRTRKIALLAQLDEGTGPTSSVEFDIFGESIRNESPEVRSWVLRRPGGRPTVRLIPLVSGEGSASSRVEFEAESGRFRIRSTSWEGRRWICLVACWERPPSVVRHLTVSEQSKVCPPDRAFAVRLAWGRLDEGLVIYRSLAKPASRTFLGHQTRARFLVGRFTTAGQVIPLLTMD